MSEQQPNPLALATGFLDTRSLAALSGCSSRAHEATKTAMTERRIAHLRHEHSKGSSNHIRACLWEKDAAFMVEAVRLMRARTYDIDRALHFSLYKRLRLAYRLGEAAVIAELLKYGREVTVSPLAAALWSGDPSSFTPGASKSVPYRRETMAEIIARGDVASLQLAIREGLLSGREWPWRVGDPHENLISVACMRHAARAGHIDVANVLFEHWPRWRLHDYRTLPEVLLSDALVHDHSPFAFFLMSKGATCSTKQPGRVPASMYTCEVPATARFALIHAAFRGCANSEVWPVVHKWIGCVPPIED